MRMMTGMRILLTLLRPYSVLLSRGEWSLWLEKLTQIGSSDWMNHECQASMNI